MIPWRARALTAVTLVLALAACSSETAEDARGEASPLALAPAASLGVYLVDGSTNDPEDGSIVYQLSNRTDPRVVAESRYFEGPDLLGAECLAITERLAQTICADVRSGRVRDWAVFGYSRGAFIANKGASLALARCGRPPLPSSGTIRFLGPYLYGGFIDAVAMSPYLDDANWVPTSTLFHHVHRRRTDALLYPVRMFGGGLGENEPGPDLDHVGMGYSVEVRDAVAREANRRVRRQVFLVPGT